MYNEFRLDMLCELVDAGIDDDMMRKIIEVVDRVGAAYDVTRKETGLVPLDYGSPRLIMEYLACKSLEGLAVGTLYNYRVTMFRFFAAVRKPLEEIQSNDIRLFLYQYQQKRGVSNRTLDKIRSHICAFFRWATSEGRIARDPSLAIRPIKHIVRPRTSLSQLEMEYVRKKLGDLRERAIIETLYSTGCRVSELCGLKKADVDWQECSAQVFGKGGKYRTVFINAKAYVALMDYLASRTDDSEYLFVSLRKPFDKLSRHSVEKVVGDISDRAFYLTGKRITPHVFRHTTATQALAHGMPIQNISRMLGHSQVETTMIYAEVNTADVQRDHNRFVV